MTRVEFYVLPDDSPPARLPASRQMAAKGSQHGMQVFIRCVDAEQSNELDELLWSFRAERFIPHEQDADEPQTPVVIGIDQAPPFAQGLLINLASTLSPHLDQFSRIIEIVNQEPQLLTACRENFRLYRRQGYDPQRVEL